MKATVIFNDYDDFSRRIKSISTTKILRAIKRYDDKGFVDYVSLSANLLFSMNYLKNIEELKNQTFYNRVCKSNYDANGYLEGVEIVREDYKILFEKYSNLSDVVFLVDPPYLSIETPTYSSNNYWKLSDYLDVLNIIIGDSYIYFTSNKSHIVELCQWIENRTITANSFVGSEKISVSTSTGCKKGYTDITLYKYSCNGK